MGQSMGKAELLTLSPAYAITAATWHTCGLRGDGEAVCWGDNSNQGSSPPGGSFAAVSAGGAVAVDGNDQPDYNLSLIHI